MKTIFISGFLIIWGLNIFGQVTYPTSDSVHIFWQPKMKITYRDYIGTPQKEVEELMDKYGFSASASVGIWSVLDIPKKKRDRYKKFEKVYFAPAFERTTSFTRTNDSMQIEIQNIYFDMCEYWARWARQQLSAIQDSTEATGTLTIMYMTIKQKMEEEKLKMFRSYFNSMFIEKEDSAFARWRKLIDTGLANTTEWTTRPEECYRLMSGKPIEGGYIKAPKVIGPMFDNKE